MKELLPDINELVSIVTTAAKEELLPRFTRVERSFKDDGSIVTEADLAMQTRIGEALTKRWPHIPMMGEEMDESEQQRLLETSNEGLWILDPLDGTSNFAAGIPYFSVSLALLVEGEPVMGIVYDPVRDECFSARRGDGMQLNGRPFRVEPAPLPLAKCIAIVDYKRLAPELAGRLASNPPFSSQRSFGSVALDWCYIAAGRGHVYLHGKMKLWDLVAGWLILEEAGGHSQTLDGNTVYIPTLEPRSALAALDGILMNEWAIALG